jgi:hypothetical protein
MGPLPWRVLARAEVTKRLAHGDRYLETRLFLADGRIMEQVNPGIADLENDWREIGRFRDLNAALAEMHRAGWRTTRESGSTYLLRTVLVTAAALLAPIAVYLALTR